MEKYNSTEGLTGEIFEVECLPLNQQGWNGDIYKKLMEEKRFKEANDLIVSWVVDKGIVGSKKEWNILRENEKTEVVLDWFKTHYPEGFNPNNPETPNEILMSLYTESVQAITQGDKNKDSLVNLYPTLRSMPDSCYGVDCFLDFDGVKFTIDVTLNREKLEHKADLILRPEMVYDENGELDAIKIQGLAQDIGRIMLGRWKERETLKKRREVA